MRRDATGLQKAPSFSGFHGTRWLCLPCSSVGGWALGTVVNVPEDTGWLKQCSKPEGGGGCIK